MKIHGNIELARLIESVSAEDDAAYVHAMKELSPSENWGTFKFKGGEACYVGNSPFSNSHGFGTDASSHDLAQLEEIEGFFASKKCPSILSVAGVVEPSIFKTLFNKNYGTLGCRNVYIFDESHCIKNNVTGPDVAVREVTTKEELNTWLQVVSDGFAGKSLDRPDPISIGQSIKKGNRFFVGYLGDEPVAASTLYLNGEVARLGGMGTLINFRGNGFQNLMIRHRLQLALDEGCKYIFSDTQPGNNSQRNLERNGLKLAYIRIIFRKMSA